MSQQEQENGQPEGKIAAYSGGGAPDREEMVAQYLPDGDDWPAKTVLELNDPALLAALSQMGEMYPEVDDLQPIIDEVMQKFLKSKTSIGGASRQEYKTIFESMFGGGSSDDDTASALANALAGDLEDD